MSKCRWLFDNLIIAESMLTVSSLRSGMVTTAKKEGTGSAIMTPSGSFLGAADLEYTVEIDSIAAGAEVGQATFKWSDGSGTWDGSGITTLATNILLNNGIYAKFTAGSGADFVVGDKWQFKGINLFNPAKMIDLDRDKVYRSAGLLSPNTITITFATEQQIDALILYDHNLTSAATITLWGDDAATFNSDGGNAQVIETITWAADKILHYLTTADRTKKYWQLRITDLANPDTYIEIGELYFGSYMELSSNYKAGFSKPIKLLSDSNVTPYGVKRKRYYNQQREFTYDFWGLTTADLMLLKTMIDNITDKDIGIQKPIFFDDNPAVTGNFWLMNIEELPEQHKGGDWYETTLKGIEVMKSV